MRSQDAASSGRLSLSPVKVSAIARTWGTAARPSRFAPLYASSVV
ncbi:MAG TPA: hypothetical protein VHT91_00975 [Kofleriaceae bacterium]|nr:hypothetical protein [Kofleriaceae bacterium]